LRRFGVNLLLGRQETGQAVAELMEPEPLYPLALPIKVDRSLPLHRFTRLPVNPRFVLFGLGQNTGLNSCRVEQSHDYHLMMPTISHVSFFMTFLPEYK